MKTLVSLVSEQTLPNVELIKEFKNQIGHYIFFHSKKTSNELRWIIEAANLHTDTYETIEIDPFDINSINQLLSNFAFEDEYYILNITGGTKLWLIAFLERFKEIGADIFYLTGANKDYLKIFPQKGKRQFQLQSNINLAEYLTAYGFRFNDNKCYKDKLQSRRLLDIYLEKSITELVPVFRFFQSNRGIKSTIHASDLSSDVKEFLELISYDFSNGLSKYDCKYLSGEWLEEFVYYQLKDELKLPDDDIKTGITITKEGNPNEMDVIFVKDHKLYVIECKTSIFTETTLPSGKQKQVNLLGEIIYKSDALRNKFGLFAKSTILTLEELRNDNNEPLEIHRTHFERANLSKINIVSRKNLINCNSLSDIIIH